MESMETNREEVPLQPAAASQPAPSEQDTIAVPAKKKRKVWRVAYNTLLYLFALAGFGMLGAYAFYQLGFTKNKGAVDKNYRYLMSVAEMESLKDSTLTAAQVHDQWTNMYLRLAAFSKFYPTNAQLIRAAAEACGDPMVAERMMAAAAVYTDGNEEYKLLADNLVGQLQQQPQQDNANVIPWMNTVEWEALKNAILRDSALLRQAGEISGVEPRKIVGCLVGEQIRLFNSKREMFKKYLGPMQVLSVQSQFSYGVNGVKEFTAIAVEQHLKDTASPFYMGKRYENILDFETDDPTTERYNRLVDYRNHLYSYIYTGCILHQTMLQWRRAGYDIADRPDILFTLFNVGFSQSHPKPDPRTGGSHITVDDREYTFGAIGFDFYYSGELAQTFPYWPTRFVEDDGNALTKEEVQAIQSNVSDCNRPEKGLEYKNQKPVVRGADAVNVIYGPKRGEPSNVGGVRPWGS